MAATKARSSVRNYGIRIKLEQALLRKFQGREEVSRAKTQGSKTHRVTSHTNDSLDSTGNDISKAAHDEYLVKAEPDSEFGIYMRGLKSINKSLKTDQ